MTFKVGDKVRVVRPFKKNESITYCWIDSMYNTINKWYTIERLNSDSAMLSNHLGYALSALTKENKNYLPDNLFKM